MRSMKETQGAVCAFYDSDVFPDFALGFHF